MKTKTPKKTTVENPETALAGATCFRPMKTLDEITNIWLSEQHQGMKRAGDNDTSHLSDISIALKMICHSYQNQSFNFNDVLSLTRHLDTAQSALIPLWHSWVKTMQEHRRLRVINIVGMPQYTFQ